MSINDYTKVERTHSACLLHNEKPVWIVEYPGTWPSTGIWQAYKATDPIPKGREPWSVNNKRLGPIIGVATLEEAVALGDVA